MEITIPNFSGVSAKIATEPAEEKAIQPHSCRRGFYCYTTVRDLAEEGVGFGVPVLKQGIQTIFPGCVELASQREGQVQEVTASLH